MPPGRLPAFCFDSAAFPPAERFDRFREAADAILDVKRAEEDAGGFRIRTDIWRLGRIAVNSRADASGIRLERQRRRLRADGIDHYVVSLMLDAGCVVDADGWERTVAAGSVVLLDMARPLRMAVPGAHSLACSVPRDALDPLLPAARSWHGATATSGAGHLLAEFLASLRGRLPTLSSQEAPLVECAALSLVAAGFAPSAERLALAGEPVAQTLRQAVRRAADARLGDPELSPDTLVRAVGVSRTVLYRLLETDGGLRRSSARGGCGQRAGCSPNPPPPASRRSPTPAGSEARASSAARSSASSAPVLGRCGAS